MEQQLYAMKIADVFNPEIKKKLLVPGGENSKNNKNAPQVSTPKGNLINMGGYLNNNGSNLNQNNSNFKNCNQKIGFPVPQDIYKKPIVRDNDPIINKSKNLVNSNSKKKYHEDGVLHNHCIGGRLITSVNTSSNNKIFPQIQNQNLGQNILNNYNNVNSIINLNCNNLDSINNLNNPTLPLGIKNNSSKTSINFIENSTLNSDLHKNSHNNNEKIIPISNILNDVLSNTRQLLHSSNSNNNDTTSTSSKEDSYNFSHEDKHSDLNLDFKKSDLETLHVHPPSHKLYSIRDNSRFSFADSQAQERNTTNSNNDCLIEVPNFIQNILLKKSETFLLTRNIKHIEDFFYSDKGLETELKNNNHWAQFIIENKEDIYKDRADKELIEDFDYINNLVLNKYQKYK
jgi:hypothetical protein